MNNEIQIAEQGNNIETMLENQLNTYVKSKINRIKKR